MKNTHQSITSHFLIIRHTESQLEIFSLVVLFFFPVFCFRCYLSAIPNIQFAKIEYIKCVFVVLKYSFRGQKIYLLARRYPSASERLVCVLSNLINFYHFILQCSVKFHLRFVSFRFVVFHKYTSTLNVFSSSYKL